eukprot:gene14535-biopygen12644
MRRRRRCKLGKVETGKTAAPQALQWVEVGRSGVGRLNPVLWNTILRRQIEIPIQYAEAHCAVCGEPGCIFLWLRGRSCSLPSVFHKTIETMWLRPSASSRCVAEGPLCEPAARGIEPGPSFHPSAIHPSIQVQVVTNTLCLDPVFHPLASMLVLPKEFITKRSIRGLFVRIWRSCGTPVLRGTPPLPFRKQCHNWHRMYPGILFIFGAPGSSQVLYVQGGGGVRVSPDPVRVGPYGRADCRSGENGSESESG